MALGLRAVIAMALAMTMAAMPSEAGRRSSAVRAEFVKLNPCPATGKSKGRCPGWEVDHRIALMCGGTDTVDNLQWLTVEAHRKKTARERRECRPRRQAQT